MAALKIVIVGDYNIVIARKVLMVHLSFINYRVDAPGF